MIYLDHNSTTPLASEAADAMAEWQAAKFGNPASQHAAGRRARQALEAAREHIASILGANLSCRHADRLIFTSGGTEANNLALLGITGCLEPNVEPGEVVISALEHPSITAPADLLSRRDWRVAQLLAREDGCVEAAALAPLLSERTRLVSVMLANNETGVLQPVEELANACRQRKILMHTDAVQVAGKIPLDFGALGVDALTVAAHKFHGPLGIGALILRHDVPLQAQLMGGVQQAGFRGGTESVALAVGMQAALNAWQREASTRAERMRMLRDHLESGLMQRCGPVEILGQQSLVGQTAPRLPQTSCVAFLGLDRQALVMALDLAGVACSTGSACASGSSEPSPVLIAMGCRQEVLNSAVRFSLGATTTSTDIDNALERIVRVCQQMRATRRTIATA